MPQNTIVRRKVFVTDPLKHAAFCFSPQNPVVWERNISEIVDSAGISFEDYFFRMYFEFQFFSDKDFDFLKRIQQKFSVAMHKDKIIHISRISSKPQLLFYKPIQFIH